MIKCNFLLIYCTIFFLIPLRAQEASSLIPVSITIQNTPLATSQSTNTTQQVVYFSQNMYVNIKNVLEPLIDKSAIYAQGLLKLLTTYAKHNKKKIFYATCCVNYIFLSSVIAYLSYILSKKVNWSLWNQSLDFEHLKNMPQQLLTQDLINSIQQVYQSEKNISDFFTPFIQFFQDIELEKQAINRLLFIEKMLEITCCRRIFLRYHSKEILTARLARLGYLRQFLLVWLAEYKLAMNTPVVGKDFGLQEQISL